MNSLAERIRAKTEQERQEVETLTRQQFDALSQSLSESSKNALSTTEAAILSQLTSLERNVTSHCRTLSLTFGKRWLQVVFLTSAVILAAAASMWGISAFFQSKAGNLRQEITELAARKIVLEKTVSQLEAKTWGLELSENEKGRFIILPPKVTPKTGWTVGNQQAIKLE